MERKGSSRWKRYDEVSRTQIFRPDSVLERRPFICSLLGVFAATPADSQCAASRDTSGCVRFDCQPCRDKRRVGGPSYLTKEEITLSRPTQRVTCDARGMAR